MTKRFFVTGTDTEVGKTVASSALLQAANQLGFNTAGYKPVASGSDLTAQGLRNEDALALQRNSLVALRYEQVNPYTFAEPTSPHIISADEGRPIAATTLSSGLRELEAPGRLGAGGRGGRLVYAALGNPDLRRLGAAGAVAGDFSGRRQTWLYQSRDAHCPGGTRSRAAARGLDRQRYPATG